MMTRRQVLLTWVIVAVAGLLGGALCEGLRGGATYAEAPEVDADEDGPRPEGWAEQILGIVQDGRFRRLAPEPAMDLPVRLTAIKMYEAISPEAAELDLTDYEGRAIMIRGLDAGGWIYSAAVIDRAGPILTAVVQRLFGEHEDENEDEHDDRGTVSESD